MKKMKLKNRIKYGYLIMTDVATIRQYLHIKDVEPNGQVVGFHSTSPSDIKPMTKEQAYSFYDIVCSTKTDVKYSLVKVTKITGSKPSFKLSKIIGEVELDGYRD